MIPTATLRERSTALLDEEIATLHLESERRRHLIARRNNLTQLCRMPDEIIARILWYNQVLTGTVKRDDYKHRAILRTAFGDFDLAWARATLVCRHVRRVALDTSYLWSILECRQDSRRQLWNQLCLKRSKNASLTLYVTLYSLVQAQATLPESILDRAVPRVRYLHIDVASRIMNDASMHDLLSPLINTASPRLEWLKVAVPREYTLGPQFLDGSCHRLSRVSIKNINMSHSQPPPMPALVWLHLAVRDIGPSGMGLYQLLRQTPLLECLDIQGDGRTLPDEELRFKEHTFDRGHRTPIPSAYLPRLRILHLTAKITWIASILSMVPIPSQALYIENTSGRHVNPNVLAEENVPWDYSSDTAKRVYGVVHDALLTFWRQNPRTEDASLPDVRLVTAIVDATLYIGQPFLPKHVTRGSSVSQLFIHYHTRASLNSFIPLAGHIETLNFRDSLAFPHQATHALSNVRRVIIEKALDTESLGDIATWLDVRFQERRPLTRIEFNISSRVFVRKYAEQLARRKIADGVT